MATQRFTTTRLGGLSAAGRIDELQHSVVAPFLARELGPRHGRLFADFEPEGSDVRAWYAEAEAPPRRLADLPPVQAEALRAATAELVGDVAALAERLAAGTPRQVALSRALRAATTFPEEDVWCEGDQPVIVNWGFHRQEVPAGTPQAILDAGRLGGAAAAGPSPPRPIAPPPIAPPPIAPAPVPAAWDGTAAPPDAPVAAAWRRPARLALGLPLWLLFALLVAACLRMLLPACGLAGGWPFSGLGVCEGDAARLDDSAREGARLQALMRQEELRLAEERRICAPSTVVTPAAAAAGRDAAVEGRLPASAPRGDVEVSLMWEGHADLDLIVDCPGGDKLSQGSAGLQACGGRLLRDVNKAGEPLLDHPIEHAAWDHPAAGRYGIAVQLFGYNDAPENSDVPFTVRVRQGADVRRFDGHIRGAHVIVTVATVTF